MSANNAAPLTRSGRLASVGQRAPTITRQIGLRVVRSQADVRVHRDLLPEIEGLYGALFPRAGRNVQAECPSGGAYHDEVLRTAWWTLRQPRYAALSAFMSIIAILCVVAGTWQIARYEQSVRDNNALTGNAHAAPVPLSSALVPLVGAGPAPDRNAIRYRTVTTTGTYLSASEQYVGGQSVNGEDGYYVLTPLRTAAGTTLLVVRGFIADPNQNRPPTSVRPAPTGAVQISGRLQTPDSAADEATRLGQRELASINPGDQATRLGAPVYNAYLTLTAGQPGTSGLTALPEPDLSNPAGGAYEAQHFAYILQWYLFALLALAAPFAFARHEVREAQRQYLGIDPGEVEFGGDDPFAPSDAGIGPGSGSAEVAVRAGSGVARTDGPSTAQWRQAARLADRYGRSLGQDNDERARLMGAAGSGATVEREARVPAPNSASTPHRSGDAYHGSYNDYLWQLALADGTAPTVEVPEIDGNRGDDKH